MKLQNELNELDNLTFPQRKSLYKIFDVADLNPENMRSFSDKTPVLEEQKEDDYRYVNIHMEKTPDTSIEDSMRGNGDVRIVGISLSETYTAVNIRIGSNEEEKIDATIFFGAPEDIEGGGE